MNIDFIKKMLSEKNGKPSFMRTMTGWMIFWFVLVLAFGFVVTVFKYESVIFLFAGLLVGALLGALGIKNNQKIKEKAPGENEQQ